MAPRQVGDQSREGGRQRCGASCQAGVTIRHTGGGGATIRRQESGGRPGRAPPGKRSREVQGGAAPTPASLGDY